MLWAALQATMSKPVMPIVITEYTVDPAEAQPPVEVAPGVSCAIQAPDVAPPPQLVGAAVGWLTCQTSGGLGSCRQCRRRQPSAVIWPTQERTSKSGGSEVLTQCRHA